MNFQSQASKDLKADLNGEGYSGKPTPYEFLDTAQACSDKGANGVPLPNREILLFPSGQALLVRENCADITPITVDAKDLTVTNDGNVIYQNQTFASNANQGDFDVLAASCPAGKTMLANPVRTSLLLDPLYLLSPEWWSVEENTVTFAGTMGSLPFYQIQKNNPNALENWRRIGQHPSLVAGENYVFSFYVKPDPSQVLSFIAYYPSGMDLQVKLDLGTGAVVSKVEDHGTLQAATARMFAGGIYISLYFQTQYTGQPDFGIGADTEYVGTQIQATALQLEKVSNFCSP